MPTDEEYLPLQVGAAGKPSIGFARDDTGDNISDKNPGYCELTGLYWAWKNLPDERTIGLVHYRRLFRASPREMEAALDGADCILPSPRNYFIETTYSQYAHAHHAVDLDTTRAIISERTPSFLPAFDSAMSSTRGHRFNMMVMRRPLLDEYCEWLFGILFELESRLDTSSYSLYDARVYGFVAERLVDVFVSTRGLRIAEFPVRNLESQHWPVKIWRFLRRKYFRR